MRALNKGQGVIDMNRRRAPWGSGKGIVLDPNPDGNGCIWVNFTHPEADYIVMINEKELDEWPTDMNGRLIEEGNLILYPVKGGRCGSMIRQGVVETIKQGKNSGLGGSITFKIGIREDLRGKLKAISGPGIVL